ncbi:aldehyde dehydrogenase [Rathayibacter sp. Leaf248]|nr:aldehyde dehydrogenase [Rathayibacter sp. Leaf248]
MAWQQNCYRMFIGGQWWAPSSPAIVRVISPVTEQEIASVPAADAEAIDRAVGAARAAFDAGPWPRLALADRVAVLRRLEEGLRRRGEELARLITDEMGSPITQSRAIQVGNASAVIAAFLDLADTYPFEVERTTSRTRALVTREPVGVVAAVVPWNMPLVAAIQKVVPALLAGCAVILKPSPETPLDAYLLAELLSDAGLPAGAFNVCVAEREISEYLVTHPGVDKVAFTGSTAAGRRIASLCGRALRRVTLELGGKSAGIVLDDADLDRTVEKLRLGSFRNSGQVCSLKTRLLVSERRLPEFTERLVSMIESMPVGDPLDPTTQIGPLVSRRQRDIVESYIESGREQGAKLALGGGRPAGLDHGWYVQPTVFTGVDPGLRIAREEIFGPVLAVIPYADEEQAVAIANDSVYGLNGAVYTDDVERGVAVARRLRTGTVEVDGNPVGVVSPSGGFKASGIGRENGREGLDAYTEIKSIGLPLRGSAG